VSENQAWFLKGIWVGALAVILVCAAAIGGGLASYFMLSRDSALFSQVSDHLITTHGNTVLSTTISCV
jgi:hypothetical protein